MRNFIMMDYEVFKAVVKENFLRYLPEEYRDAEISVAAHFFDLKLL